MVNRASSYFQKGDNAILQKGVKKVTELSVSKFACVSYTQQMDKKFEFKKLIFGQSQDI